MTYDGTFPINLDTWMDISAHFGKPWSSAAAVADLRFWVALTSRDVRVEVTLPSAKTLGARWGWVQRRAARLIAQVSRWSAPGQEGQAMVAVELARGAPAGLRAGWYWWSTCGSPLLTGSPQSGRPCFRVRWRRRVDA